MTLSELDLYARKANAEVVLQIAPERYRCIIRFRSFAEAVGSSAESIDKAISGAMEEAALSIRGTQ